MTPATRRRRGAGLLVSLLQKGDDTMATATLPIITTLHPKRIDHGIVWARLHPNGRIAATVHRYSLGGNLYETTRFYSTSGVFHNWIDQPA